MYFTDYVLGPVWDYPDSKQKDKQYKQKTPPKSYKTEVEKKYQNSRYLWTSVGSISSSTAWLLRGLWKLTFLYPWDRLVQYTVNILS